MCIELSKKEAITLIIEFYYVFTKVPKEMIEEDFKIKEFIENGYAELDDENGDFYVLSKTGDDTLHLQIEEISNKYIDFMYSKGNHISKNEGISWYVATYDLDDRGLGENIFRYINSNLKTYGYECICCHSTTNGNSYKLRKTEDD